MTILVRANQHDTLDLLCWRHLGTTIGVVEAALELNRNQLKFDATLQHGQLVKLPDPPTQTAPKVDIVNLWD
jgi:phage tail protein X